MEIDSDAILDHESALEYARFHGLCLDYTSEDMQMHNLIAPSVCEINRDLQELSVPITTNEICELTRERLSVNKDTALLLKAIHSLRESPTEGSLTTDRRRWILGLKQELPVLATDPELDVLRFGNVAMPDLRNSRIPSELTNQENDEGFEWPCKYLAYPGLCDERIKTEKFAVTREDLLYLQDAIQDDHVPGDAMFECAKDYKYKINAGVRPITPPLLPLSPPLTPYIPSSPTNRLPLPSGSSDSVTVEAKELERQIMDADSLPRLHSDNSDSMLLEITNPPPFSPLSVYNDPPMLKRSAEHLKVEGPLTPPMFSTSPMKKIKSVSFSEILAEYIPTMKLADSSDDGGGSSVNFDDYDDLLREIEPLATQARRSIENEQLSGADTTARVDIPDLDFSLPVAPWAEYSQSRANRRKRNETELDAQSTLIKRIKREDLKNATSWHGVSALERELRWSIFTTQVSPVNLEEKLHGEVEWDNLLAELNAGDIATSSSLIWKRDGLRLLDEEEEEQEQEIELEEELLESEKAEEQRDVETLIRKRRLEMEDDSEEQARKRTALRSDFRAQGQKKQDTLASHHWRDTSPTRTRDSQYNQAKPQASNSRQKTMPPPKETGDELMFGGFSASTALHKFMETRGKPMAASIAAQTQQSSMIANPQMLHTLPVRSREPSQEVSTIAAPVTSHPAIKKYVHPIALPKHLPPCSFIVSSILLHRRSLLKQIEHLYPSAEIIYRDYTLPHSASDEADMILSPSTGLIFTTLQQVKQRALPGQPDRSLLKERMLALQFRYERLLVMVSEGLTREMEERGSPRPTDSRDEDAIAQFEAFAANLEGTLLVEFVKGGEQGFARSLVLKMAEFGLPHGSVDIGDIKPLAVETSWECFLRRAGLNPFAAQVIVASLKTPIEVQAPGSAFMRPGTVRVCGLPAFLMMREADRIQYLQAIMGGGRILKKVSKVLDQEWVSAAHGFRLR